MIKRIRVNKTFHANFSAQRYSFHSACFFAVKRVCSRSMRRKRISVSSVSPRCTRGRRAVVAECPFIFIFVAFPRGAVSPYIYLIASSDSPGVALHLPAATTLLAALAYSRPRVLCASIIRAVSLPALACPRNN